MMAYELSICIPTYNRAKYLPETLNSVINQLDESIRDKVEICISDNASQDNTRQIIESYKAKHPHITYFRWDKNMGADNNYLKVVEIARGKYCWFLGSDDIIKQNSLAKILSELKLSCDLYLCNVDICDINMNFIKKYKIFKKNVHAQVFTFGTPEKLEIYLSSTKRLASLFGYLSCIIFLKEKWDSINFDKTFIGSAWSHTYMLLSMLKYDNSLKYIDEYLVCNRSGNDSFSEEGIAKRALLDLNGYSTLITALFTGYIDTKYWIKQIISNEYGFRYILYVMSAQKENQALENGFLKIGYSKTYLLLIKILKYPYRLMRHIKKFIRG